MLRGLIEGIRSLVGGSGPSGEEARHKMRVRCRYPVVCTNPQEERFGVSVIDISRAGMRLEGNKPLKTGQPLTVYYGPALASPVEVVVVWCRRRAHDGMALSGVRYAQDELAGSWVQQVLDHAGLAGEDAFRKRKHMRMSADLAAEFRHKGTGQFLGEGKVSNLSLGGVQVDSTDPVPVGEQVLVLIAPPGRYPRLSLTGRVVSSRTQEDGHAVNIQFVNVAARDARLLKRYLFALVKERGL